MTSPRFRSVSFGVDLSGLWAAIWRTWCHFSFFCVTTLCVCCCVSAFFHHLLSRFSLCTQCNLLIHLRSSMCYPHHLRSYSSCAVIFLRILTYFVVTNVFFSQFCFLYVLDRQTDTTPRKAGRPSHISIATTKKVPFAFGGQLLTGRDGTLLRSAGPLSGTDTLVSLYRGQYLGTSGWTTVEVRWVPRSTRKEKKHSSRQSRRTSTWPPIDKGWWRKKYCSISAKQS